MKEKAGKERRMEDRRRRRRGQRSLMLESFRFKEEDDDYKYEIFSVLSGARA